MPITEATLESLTVDITEEMIILAPLEETFSALLEQMGPGNEGPDGAAMPMKLEAFPGGRWYRDLGGDNGHYWGTVQAIKRPGLLEITGPLFMSSPVVSNIQYRLRETAGGTRLQFRHTAFGLVPEAFRPGLGRGWTHLHERVRLHAEAKHQAKGDVQ